MPENTIAGMLAAIDLGVTTLEFDVVITGDSQVLLSHEPYFNPDITITPDGKYLTEREGLELNIFRMSYEQIKTYDVGLKPHPKYPLQIKLPTCKPLLNDLVTTVENYIAQNNLAKVIYNIEVKSSAAYDNNYHPAPSEYADLILESINNNDIKNKVILQSFDHRILQELNKKSADMKFAMLISATDKMPVSDHIARLGFTPAYIAAQHSIINDEFVRTVRKNNARILAWTVNEISRIIELMKMNVDGIISDYPDYFTSTEVIEAFNMLEKNKAKN